MMNLKRIFTRINLPALAAALAGLVSCSLIYDDIDPAACSSMQPVQLAVHMNAMVHTKADVAKITEMGDGEDRFRGIDRIILIPFAKSGDGVVASTDAPVSYPLLFGGFQTLSQASSAHLYDSYTEFPLKTNAMLAYGIAKQESGSKKVNGSLVQGFADTYMAAKAAEIQFTPDVMLPSSGTPKAAKDLADILTAVVCDVSYTHPEAASSGTVSKEVSLLWNGSIGDPNLRDCYQQLTQEGKLIPGSRASIAALLTTLLKALKQESINADPYEFEVDGTIYLADNLTKKQMYNGLRQVIKDKLNGCSQLYVDEENATVSFKENPDKDAYIPDYPVNLGLPDGAAAVRWTPLGYVVPTQNGLDGLAPISSFCFPPSLYYRANTRIKTSVEEKETLQEAYDVESWSKILTDYYSWGTSVSTNTKSVALVDSLHFAVGMLKATVKAQSATLLDYENRTSIPVGETTFPLTGIIIGRQYPQHFDFTPIYTSDTETTQYFLYDSQIQGVNLAASSPSADFRTLVLQTPDEKSVYVSLEFQNNSGKTFYGVDGGRIFNGNKFYLVGKLDVPPEYDENGNKRKSDSVFLQDHVTTVNFVVPSLANAYSAIPDMGIPQLALGVLAQVNWELSTPTIISLE